MRVLLCSPSVRPALTGNAATADRWARGLRARGHACSVVEVAASWERRDFVEAVDGARPDLIHLHHAQRCGRFVDDARMRGAVVVSFAGTDLTLANGARAVVLRAGCRADAVVAGGDDPRELVSHISRSLAARVQGVPKGVSLGSAPFDLRREIGAGATDLVVVLPAGVRALKGPRFPIAPLERLRERGLPIRYVQLGPVLEPAEGAALARELATRTWCSRLEVAPAQVASVLRAADLVLNCSEVEGFANALAEALTCGCAVLASDVPGNRKALHAGETALLYRTGDADDFEAKAFSLLRDEAFRRSIGAAARAHAAASFDGVREIDALLSAYGEALSRAASAPRSPRGRPVPLASS